MSTRRRQAFGVVEVTEWPAVLADPGAPAWASNAATREWLKAHGVDVAKGADNGSTPAQRRVLAIRAWAHEHHPSSRWPAFIDQHWMNKSGLRVVQQAAARAARQW